MKEKVRTVRTQMGDRGATRDRSPGRRSVAVSLSRLAFEALVGESPSSPAPISARLEGAIRCYLGDRGSGRPAWAYPVFLRGDQARGEVEVELSIDADLWRSFEIEVGRQDVSLRQLLDHAAFYFVTELNSGRVTQRILDDLESAGGKED